MTVTSILLNFRSALLALVPIAEQVGIPWKRPDAYDEWDAITATLFESLVLEVLRWSLPQDKRNDFCLPSYDLLLPTYEYVSTLEVVHPSLGLGRWLFHAFGTETELFDVVEVRLLSENGRPRSSSLATCSIYGSTFRLRLTEGAGLIEEIPSLPVEGESRSL